MTLRVNLYHNAYHFFRMLHTLGLYKQQKGLKSWLLIKQFVSKKLTSI